VKPIRLAPVRPILRNPLRMATSDAPGTQLRNTSTPRAKSNASYNRPTDSEVGTPSTNSNTPRGVSSWAGVLTAASACLTRQAPRCAPSHPPLRTTTSVTRVCRLGVRAAMITIDLPSSARSFFLS
jgi:hypothetical protein